MRRGDLFADQLLSPAEMERAIDTRPPSPADLPRWLSRHGDLVERRDLILESLRPSLRAALRHVAQRLGETSERTADWVAESISEIQATLEPNLGLRVYLHPSDMAKVSARLNASAQAEITWLPDPSLSPGDCLLETDTSIQDARLQTRLEWAIEAFMQAEDLPHE